MKQVIEARQKAVPSRIRIGLDDVLLLAGVALVTGGVCAWSRPAAAILLGLMCFCGVFLITRAARRATKENER